MAKMKKQRKDPAEDLGQPAADELAGVLHARRVEILEQLRVLDARRAEVLAAVGLALVGAADRLLADVDLGDLARADGLLEVAVRDLAARSAPETTSAPARAATGPPRTYQIGPPGRARSSGACACRPDACRAGSFPEGVRRFANSLLRQSLDCFFWKVSSLSTHIHDDASRPRGTRPRALASPADRARAAGSSA